MPETLSSQFEPAHHDYKYPMLVNKKKYGSDKVAIFWVY